MADPIADGGQDSDVDCEDQPARDGKFLLERGTLFQDRDYPVLNDYRAVLGGLFRSLWSLSASQCDRVFQQTQPRDLSLV